MKTVVVLESVWKTYQAGSVPVHALRSVSLAIERGDFVAVMGPSGSGKSTLMNIIGCLDVPDSGRYLVDGVDVTALSENDLATVRNRRIGFVFQSFNLVARNSALHNVELPLIYGGVRRRDRRTRAAAALAAVGLADRSDHFPSQLSGGQQQRVAIARAMVTDPAMILADEPTGALDTESGAEVLRLFSDLNRAGRTVVLITHEADVADHAKRVVVLRDGRMVGDERRAPAAAPPLAPAR